ncbi:MAG: 30S ribosomal protein S16 [Candidatus Jorgensenbacteria bacterium]|nr:30S ribosomal protein S16 [Candidatus Jorgensenbacteria bacterium]
MLAIKLQRIGKKRQGSFRLVVAEKRSKLQSTVREDLGWLNPHTDTTELKRERVSYWLKVGAKPTDTVWNVLVRTGIVRGKKIAVHSKSKAKSDASAPAETVAVKQTAQPEAKVEQPQS